MDVEYQLRCERLRPPLRDSLHCREIVQDHLLADVAGRTPCADHLLGHLAGCDRAFQLARGDGLLDQRPDQVTVLGLRIGDRLRQADGPARSDVDLVQFLLHHLGHPKLEGLPLLVVERHRVQHAASGQLKRQPPITVAEARRCRQML